MNYISRRRPVANQSVATSLSELIETLLRHRLAIVLIVMASVGLTAGYLQLIRGDLYVAEAKLLVRLGQEQAPTPTTIADRVMMVGSQVYAVNEIEMLHNRDLVAAVVDRIDLTVKDARPVPTTLYGRIKEYVRQSWKRVEEQLDELMIWTGLKTRLTPREIAINAVLSALKVQAALTGNIVTAQMYWSKPDVAKMLLQAVLQEYYARRVAFYEGATAVKFFRDLRNESSARLDRSEAALAAFEREHAISNPDEQRTGMLRRLSEADTGVSAAKLDLNLAEASLAQLEDARRSGRDFAVFAAAQSGNSLQQALTTQIAAVAARLLQSQITLGPGDDRVRQQRAELAALSQMVEGQMRATVAQRRDQLALREGQRNAVGASLLALQNSLTEWQDLKRDVASNLRAYEFSDNKMNEANGVAARAQRNIGDVVTIQQPSDDAAPTGIRKKSILLLGLAGGVLVALMWVSVWSFFDQRLHGPADVERRLGARLVATVPFDPRSFGRRGRVSAQTDAVLARLAGLIAKKVATGDLRALAVVGGAAGEGVSTITAHVGRHLAMQLGFRVLLVNLGRATNGLSNVLHRLPTPPVQLPATPAASTEAGRWAVVEVPTSTLTAGTSTITELERLVTRSNEKFDLVLIDAPPWPDNLEALLAARCCGHVLLVAAAESLPEQVFHRINDELEDEHLMLLGCVLNRARRRMPRWFR